MRKNRFVQVIVVLIVLVVLTIWIPNSLFDETKYSDSLVEYLWGVPLVIPAITLIILTFNMFDIWRRRVWGWLVLPLAVAMFVYSVFLWAITATANDIYMIPLFLTIITGIILVVLYVKSRRRSKFSTQKSPDNPNIVQ